MEKLSKEQRKEIFYFGLSFVFFTLGVYSHMNFTPCSGFCFDIEPLLAIFWTIVGFSFILIFLSKFVKRIKKRDRQNNKPFYLLIIIIFSLFLFLSYIITFSNVDRSTGLNEYPNKYAAFELLNQKLHICYLNKFYQYGGYDNEPDTYYCYQWWADKLDSPYFCSKYKGWGNHDTCYSNFAIQKKNVKICNNIVLESRSECVNSYISATGDVSGCEVLSGEYYVSCITGHTNLTSEDCSILGLTSEKCSNILASQTRNISYCYSIESNDQKELCIFNNANAYEDCFEINNAEFQSKCKYRNIVIPDDCNKSLEAKDLCIYNEHIQKKLGRNISVCSTISSSDYRNKCIFYSIMNNYIPNTWDPKTCSLITEEVELYSDVVYGYLQMNKTPVDSAGCDKLVRTISFYKGKGSLFFKLLNSGEIN